MENKNPDAQTRHVLFEKISKADSLNFKITKVKSLKSIARIQGDIETAEKLRLIERSLVSELYTLLYNNRKKTYSTVLYLTKKRLNPQDYT
jgi:hypothetical protein